MTANERLQYAVVGDFVGDAVRISDVRRFANMYGLEREHFQGGAAFDAAMAFEGEDKPTLYHEIAKALLPEDCDRAVESAAVNLLDCESHVRLIVDDYVMERIASIPLEAKKAFSGTRDRRK